MGVCVRGRGEECGRIDRKVWFGWYRSVCVCEGSGYVRDGQDG